MPESGTEHVQTNPTKHWKPLAMTMAAFKHGLHFMYKTIYELYKQTNLGITTVRGQFQQSILHNYGFGKVYSNFLQGLVMN